MSVLVAVYVGFNQRSYGVCLGHDVTEPLWVCILGVVLCLIAQRFDGEHRGEDTSALGTNSLDVLPNALH